MAFYESPRFPDRIAMGATGGPRFTTTIVTSASGREARNAEWSYPLHEWDVSQGVNGQTDFEALRAFFMTMRGRQHGWRFKDWTDFSATHTTGVVSGITGTTFQLVKRYTSGAQSMDRVISKPLASGFVLKDSGVTLTLTTDYTLNTVTGVVTTAISRTAANLTWAGEFDVPMRFDTDRLVAAVVARTGHSGLMHQWDQIPIVEIRT